jgi:zinc transporter 1
MTGLNLCIGAFFNGVFLLALALSICLQSMERFIIVEVVTSPELVLIVGCIGLVLNIIGAIVVHGKRRSVD